MNTRVKCKYKKIKREKRNKKKIFHKQKQVRSKGQQIVCQINKTILHYFPDLIERMQKLPDYRERKQYEISELVTGGIAMFLFKEGSRNGMNNDRKEYKFIKNYQRLFKLELPHMDAVDNLMAILKEEELEQLKATLVATLIEQRVFRKFKFLGKKYNITVDGTGIASYDKRHCEACLTKTSKKGKITYFHNVMEAKLVTSNGFSISLATEWISNEGKSEYDKQDCELNAFKRLAIKIKHYFPRLPILITADGLYPNQSFFKICLQNEWDFIVTLQDKSLKALQEEINWLKRIDAKHTRIFHTDKTTRTTCKYSYLNELEYKEFHLSWVECIETTVNIKSGETKEIRFVHLSNLKLDDETAVAVSDEGRLRWKIENEGFNTQKNGGYGLEHKYSRTNFNAMKNYYQCLQIAHIINQLATKSQNIAELFIQDAKFTICKLWERLKSFLIECELKELELIDNKNRRFQIRLI
jgi:hypothetical protein